MSQPTLSVHDLHMGHMDYVQSLMTLVMHNGHQHYVKIEMITITEIVTDIGNFFTGDIDYAILH
jgi:hydroxymethylpyrimidine/phosphomethylpyrimidine kinase